MAAHLAAGAHFEDLGEDVDPASLVRLDLRPATVADGELVATVLDVDRFGNLELNVSEAEIDALGLVPGGRVELRLALTPYYAVLAETYADASRGELILYEGSYGKYGIAINGGSAATLTESSAGDEVRIPARALSAGWGKWRGPDLNRRHHGFQPCALPAELPRLETASLAAPWAPPRCGRQFRSARPGPLALAGR